MALDRKQREQVIKFMGMTGSANDHEALAHLKRVQKILRDNDMSWEELLHDSDFLFLDTMKRLHEAQTEIERLRAELVTASNDNRLDELKQERDALRAERDELAAQVQDLLSDLAALQPEPDPMEAELAEFFATDDRDRYTSEYLLREFLEVPERHINTDIYRRLGRCMRRLGGWRASNNIPDEHGTRVRGYQRPNPWHRRKPE